MAVVGHLSPRYDDVAAKMMIEVELPALQAHWFSTVVHMLGGVCVRLGTQLGQLAADADLEMQAEMWDRSNPGFWLVMVGSWLSLIVQYGLTSVAGGVAWRYLSGEERG